MGQVKSIKSEGRIFANHLTLTTDLALTAGRPIKFDVSGTDRAAQITAGAEVSAFGGILLETLTGPATGITYATEGVFEFTAIASTDGGYTGCQWFPGSKCYVVDGNSAPSGIMIRPWGNTAATLTGIKPIGVASAFPLGAITSGEECTVWVKILPYVHAEDQIILTN